MPNRLDAEKRGVGVGRNVDGSNLTTGDSNRFEDGRSNNVSVQFAPTDASLRQPGVVYTLQEVLAAMDRKLDTLSNQVAAMTTKLISIEFEQAALKRELDEIKDGEQGEERERRQQFMQIVLVAGVLALVVIIGMLAWLIVHLGAM